MTFSGHLYDICFTFLDTLDHAFDMCVDTFVDECANMCVDTCTKLFVKSMDGNSGDMDMGLDETVVEKNLN